MVSILTPLGAALIGLSETQSFSWTALSGAEKTITVLTVEQLDRASVMKLRDGASKAAQGWR